MTITQALLSFTAAAGLLTVTPGLDTALVLRTAAVERPRLAMLTGAGICLGCLTWGLVASAGLGTLLAVSRPAYTGLRILGACYLILFGVQLFRREQTALPNLHERGSVDSQQVNARATGARWFARGFLTNVLNPKVGIFYVTFLPQFVPNGVHVLSFSIVLASIHAAEGLLWFLTLTLATKLLSRWLQHPQVVKILDRTTGAVLVGFGCGLLFDNRD